MNKTQNIIVNHIPENWKEISFIEWMYNLEKQLEKSRL